MCMYGMNIGGEEPRILRDTRADKTGIVGIGGFWSIDKKQNRRTISDSHQMFAQPLELSLAYKYAHMQGTYTVCNYSKYKYQQKRTAHNCTITNARERAVIRQQFTEKISGENSTRKRKFLAKKRENFIKTKREKY